MCTYENMNRWIRIQKNKGDLPRSRSEILDEIITQLQAPLQNLLYPLLINNRPIIYIRGRRFSTERRTLLVVIVPHYVCPEGGGGVYSAYQLCNRLHLWIVWDMFNTRGGHAARKITRCWSIKAVVGTLQEK